MLQQYGCWVQELTSSYEDDYERDNQGSKGESRIQTGVYIVGTER